MTITNTCEELDKFLFTLKIHNKDLDVCFNDYLAVAHLKELVAKEISKAKEEAFNEGRKEAIEEQMTAKDILTELRRQGKIKGWVKIDDNEYRVFFNHLSKENLIKEEKEI